MTLKRGRLGPWTCTLAAALGLVALVAGGGYVVDDDGLARKLITHTEAPLWTIREWTASVGTLGALVEDVRRQNCVDFEVDWASFRERNITPQTPCTYPGTTSPMGLFATHFAEMDNEDVDQRRMASYRLVLVISRFGDARITRKLRYIERGYDLTGCLHHLPVLYGTVPEGFKTWSADKQKEFLRQGAVTHNDRYVILLALLLGCTRDAEFGGPTVSLTGYVATVRATPGHHQQIRDRISNRLGVVSMPWYLEALWGR